ncbi:MAG: hypothetical protein NVSMB13_15160 [Mycobacteriales bacterium]
MPRRTHHRPFLLAQGINERISRYQDANWDEKVNLLRVLNARMMAAALLACLGVLVAIAANQPLVSGFHEQRPFVAMPGALLLVKHSVDPGFPSDHAVMAGAVAAALFFVSRRLAWVGVVLALVMAFARVYVGVHYPSDVLAGLAVGAVVAVLVELLLGRPVAMLVRRLEDTALRPLLAGPSRSPARV